MVECRCTKHDAGVEVEAASGLSVTLMDRRGRAALIAVATARSTMAFALGKLPRLRIVQPAPLTVAAVKPESMQKDGGERHTVGLPCFRRFSVCDGRKRLAETTLENSR